MLIKVQSWLRQPKVWRFVCFVSSVVGLFCYALSSSFNDLLGKWSWWKILLYIVFTFIICLAVLFAKARQRSTSLRLEAHVAFLVLMITSVYSFFIDKVVKGKPDAYSLVSCAAFAIMSLGLSRLSHFGFGVDLLYFFSGLLTIQFMKIKLWLVIVGGCFSYSLIKLRSTLDDVLITGDVENQVVAQDIESGSLSLQTSSSASRVDSPQVIITAISKADALLGNEDLVFLVTQVDSDSQQDNSDNYDNRQFDPLLHSNLSNRKDKSWRSVSMESALAQLREQQVSSLIELLSSERSISDVARFEPVIDSCTVIEKEKIREILIARFMSRIEALKKKNGSVIDTISKHVDQYLKANVVNEEQISVPQIYRDDNLVLDALRSDGDNIVGHLGETAMLMVMVGIKEECCRAYCSWRREFLNESLSTFGLLPQELNMEDIDKTETIECWIKALSVAVRILFPNERRLCLYVFGNFTSSADFAFTEVCTGWATRLLRNVKVQTKNFRNILEELMYEFPFLFSGEYCKSLRKDCQRVRKGLGIVTNGEEGLHLITGEVVNYIRNGSSVKYASDGMLSSNAQVTMITRLFERSLKTNSKKYNNPTLGYLFILNNRSYIDREADLYGFGAIGYHWLQKNRRKIEKNLELYQRSSWNKILNLLKLDINESEPTVAELMKDKLRSFNEHFDDICNDQFTWFVFDDQLRKKIIKSIENILLPEYGNFIGRLQDFLGDQAYKYIKYGIVEVQHRLNSLFLENGQINPVLNEMGIILPLNFSLYHQGTPLFP